jgi:hypothetical protein
MIHAEQIKDSRRAANPGKPGPLVSGGGRKWTRWGAYAGIWTALGLLTATQSYLAYSSLGRGLSWGRALAWELPGWYAWGLLAPLVVRLGRRYRLDSRGWPAGLAVHLLAGGAAATAHLYFLTWLANVVPRFARTFQWTDLAATYFHYEFAVYWAILGVGYAAEYYNKYRERELAAARLEHQLVQAQLQALKMQLRRLFCRRLRRGRQARLRPRSHPLRQRHFQRIVQPLIERDRSVN